VSAVDAALSEGALPASRAPPMLVRRITIGPPAQQTHGWLRPASSSAFSDLNGATSTSSVTAASTTATAASPAARRHAPSPFIGALACARRRVAQPQPPPARRGAGLGLVGASPVVTGAKVAGFARGCAVSGSSGIGSGGGGGGGRLPGGAFLSSAGKQVRRLADSVGGRHTPPTTAPGLLNVHVLEATRPLPAGAAQLVWLALDLRARDDDDDDDADASRAAARPGRGAAAVSGRVPSAPLPVWGEHFALPCALEPGGAPFRLRLRMFTASTAAPADPGVLLGQATVPLDALAAEAKVPVAVQLEPADELDAGGRRHELPSIRLELILSAAKPGGK
jgi:hypothetical protein